MSDTNTNTNTTNTAETEIVEPQSQDSNESKESPDSSRVIFTASENPDLFYATVYIGDQACQMGELSREKITDLYTMLSLPLPTELHPDLNLNLNLNVDE